MGFLFFNKLLTNTSKLVCFILDYPIRRSTLHCEKAFKTLYLSL